MDEGARATLSAWESFYVIVGSAGGALTGLQFVVIALIAESRRAATGREIAAFSTPTIIHFCAVLLIGAILTAPWYSLSTVAVALGTCAAGGLVYGVITVRRAFKVEGYRPLLADWIWFCALPPIAYTMLLVASALLPGHARTDLFAIGAIALLLLFIGIHNAWDTVTYIAVEFGKTKKD